MIRGVNHITLAIRDLERSVEFYQGLLGGQLVARWPKGAYLTLGSLWLALVVDDTTRTGPLPEYTHLALDIAPENFGAFTDKIRPQVKEWKSNTSEGDSLYFLDPDGHKLELHATHLQARLQAAKTQPWEGLELFHPQSNTID